jgi:RNA polymerase sigma-54 factor
VAIVVAIPAASDASILHGSWTIRRSTAPVSAGALELGIDYLKPMMIKEIAEEIGVHPSTVSRAVSSKYAHTPQGVFELRYFFSEAVQGPSGGVLPLLILKRRVKKMIEEEDTSHPLTDEHITERLQSEGIQVTRRTVAKYREDMRIPSTHQRRKRE